MVGLKRYTTLLILILLALTTMSQATLGGFAERQLKQLTMRGETISANLEVAKCAYEEAPCDSLSQLIHSLEKQSVAIQNAILRLQTQIAEANAEPEMPVAPAEEIVEAAPQEVVAEPVQEYKQEVVEKAVEKVIIEPTIEEPTSEQKEEEVIETKPLISDNLKSLFSGSQRRYALTEKEIDTLINEYADVYEQILESIVDYEKATNLQKLNGHYADYLAGVERASKIANLIADRSDLLFTSKTNAYLSFADSLGMDSLRTKYTLLSEQTEATMTAKFANKCSDLDLAMYPHRLRTTLLLEADIARQIAPESADSLTQRAENFDTTYTIFSPISTPKRSNAKFTAVSIKKNAKAKAVSSLPVLKIPSEGELYSITVGNYASLPPSTSVFRGASPLYRERREDGRTYIYIGLYPTAQSAQDDIALLRKTGFKQPTLVMWRDGIRRDDFVDKNSTTTKTTKKPTMYRIEISGAEGMLPAEAVAIIREKAPRKELSKYTNPSGAVVYTLGIFTSENEAKTLASAIKRAAPTLTTTLTQIGKK
ncbi:MAG: hypothetical protein J6U53_02070 [Tidjanibacter sp.]|nr:hypothetical protein [Tidjanibacter sp.]